MKYRASESRYDAWSTLVLTPSRLPICRRRRYVAVTPPRLGAREVQQIVCLLLLVCCAFIATVCAVLFPEAGGPRKNLPEQEFVQNKFMSVHVVLMIGSVPSPSPVCSSVVSSLRSFLGFALLQQGDWNGHPRHRPAKPHLPAVGLRRSRLRGSLCDSARLRHRARGTCTTRIRLGVQLFLFLSSFRVFFYVSLLFSDGGYNGSTACFMFRVHVYL